MIRFGTSAMERDLGERWRARGVVVAGGLVSFVLIAGGVGAHEGELHGGGPEVLIGYVIVVLFALGICTWWFRGSKRKMARSGRPVPKVPKRRS